MASRELILQGIEIASARTASLSAEQRRLSLSDHPYPIHLSALRSIDPLRFELGRASAAFGRDPGKTSGGNPTKRLRLLVVGPALKEMSAEAFALLLAKPAPRIAPGKRPKFEPLGDYLRGQATAEVRMSLDEISRLVGPLGETAASPQFWANAKGHHSYRRRHWFDAGFEAFYEPANNSVRFVREPSSSFAQAPSVWTEPSTADPEALAASVNTLRAKRKRAHRPTMPPTGSPGGVQTIGETVRFIRDPNVIVWILEVASGRCEVCEAPAPFERNDGSAYLEVHHVRPLGEGGPDRVDNAVAACPNCHRRLHHSKDRFELRAQTITKVLRLVDYPQAPVTLVKPLTTGRGGG